MTKVDDGLSKSSYIRVSITYVTIIDICVSTLVWFHCKDEDDKVDNEFEF